MATDFTEGFDFDQDMSGHVPGNMDFGDMIGSVDISGTHRNNGSPVEENPRRDSSVNAMSEFDRMDNPQRDAHSPFVNDPFLADDFEPRSGDEPKLAPDESLSGDINGDQIDRQCLSDSTMMAPKLSNGVVTTGTKSFETEIDRSALDAWEEKHKKELEEKRLEEEKAKAVQREEGAAQLARWYELQKTKQQKRKEANRQEAERTDKTHSNSKDLKGTASWDRVWEMVASVKDIDSKKQETGAKDGVSEGSKNGRDTSRLKQILMGLKSQG
eukprot:GHVQ01013149.1.p1 GENE.GHVQ01013149.1~~GHVQ01013149.1.p1  ORF type:complete len:271 (+),score=54.08 GHVQ01013149.1:197-1009(+)